MASAFAHFAIGASLALPLVLPDRHGRMGETVEADGAGLRAGGVAIVAGTLAVLPDLDTALLGVVPYEHFFGHRGFFHAPVFLAVAGWLLAAIVAAVWRPMTARQLATLGLVFSAALVSHPLLDALTDGGLGVMLLWPYLSERVFFPWRPIRVAPISVRAFFGPWGVAVLRSELPWMLGALAAALPLRAARMRRRG